MPTDMVGNASPYSKQTSVYGPIQAPLAGICRSRSLAAHGSAGSRSETTLFCPGAQNASTVASGSHYLCRTLPGAARPWTRSGLCPCRVTAKR